MEFNDIFLEVLKNKRNPSKWDNSKFENIKLIPNTQVGQVGQEFMVKVCETIGFDYKEPEGTQSPWDIMIKDVTFEIKAATEDVIGNFQFNHIRYHRSYDALICIGISPEMINFNCWTAAEVKTNKAGNLVTMEKGANASFKLTKKKSDLFPFSKINEELNRVISAVHS